MAEHINKTDTLNEGREKLNNAITAFNETVVEGDSSVEAAQARVDEKGVPHTTLKARIDDGMNSVNQQLAQTTQELDDKKMDKNTNDISVLQINKNKGKLDQTYMTDEFLQQMTGNSPIYAVPADSSLTTEKYADKSITPNKVSFIKKSTNLFNKEKLVFGKSLNPETGQPVDSGSFSYTPDYEPIEPNTPHIMGVNFVQGNIIRAMFYDSDYNFISQIAIGATHSVAASTGHENYAYVRFSVQQISDVDSLQFNKGTELLPYERYYQRLGDDIEVSGVTVNKLKNPVSIAWTNTVDVGQTRKAFEITSEFMLDYIEVSSSNELVGITITPLDHNFESTLPIGQVRVDGSNITRFTFKSIVEESSSLWNIMYHRVGSYKVALNRGLYFPNGCIIELTGSGLAETEDVSLRLYGVETI